MAKEGWVFLVEDTDVFDPMEVVYRLARINLGTGEIYQTDGYLTFCQHGVWERVDEARKNGVFVKEIDRAPREATYKAVAC